MKKRDRYLTGILLVLIGIIIGTLMAYYQQQNSVNDQAEVDVTEVKHSDRPIFSDEQLAKIDDRFLFKQISERVKPTVVYIEASVPFSGRRMPDDEIHNDEDGFWGDMIPKRAQTVGSGVIISSDGYILTNNHVIDGAVDDQIEVTLNDKRTFKGRIVGQDPTTDLAVLKIGAKNLPVVTIGNSDKVDVGEWVLAIGNPFRLRSTVTAGIVSALSRDVQIINDRMRVESFIQTDAAINKGNSGGALVNTGGELIGVNTAIASQSGNYQGYGFAVPSNLAAKVAEDLIEYGKVRRALLGVTIRSVNAATAKELQMDEIRGVQITGVSPNGAAEKAQLQADDVVLSIDGEKVSESNQLQQKVAVKHPGDIVELQIYRDGKVFTQNVELGMLESTEELASYSRQEEPEQGNGAEQKQAVQFATFEMGFRVMAVRSAPGSSIFNLIISDIRSGSPIADTGLREGFRILKVQNQKVEDLESLQDILGEITQKNELVSFTVETRNGRQKTVTFQP
ncbi:Do/DeqQ family serine protease [Fodinibius salinus]|uniref:Do/DeqQ family serine protease n=1 Tax=Fodinibius salinus TaxID=860790 RepID=A0A5D3YND6_9BACT|nr:trypsin-like peptidase domain-containing protein [Fodinibius salinus]TYP95384.1 Do/DeqQ family serine protease [Fodinibius salinus]